MKRLTALLLITVMMLLSLTACSNNKNTPPSETDNTENGNNPIDSTSTAAIDSISTDQICTLIMDMTDLNLASSSFVQEVTAENAAYTLGYENFNGSFESAYSIVPMMNVTPFVLVVFRLAEDADADAFAADLKSNANLGKWVCTSADQAEAKVSGQTVLFFMSPSEFVDPINQAFDEISAEGFVPEDHIYNPLKDIASMEDLYAKLYETFSAENYGFMDNTDVLAVTADSDYGLNQLDASQFTDSVIDDGYLEASDEDEEKSYVLAMFRLAEGVDVQEFIASVKENLDTSSLKGEDVQIAINYSDDIVTVYAGTGTYGISSTSLDIILTTEFRMKSASEE